MPAKNKAAALLKLLELLLLGSALCARAGDAAPHWAFTSLKTSELPRVASVVGFRVRNPIDAYILQKRDPHVSPRSEPSRAILIRRLSFDLRGLPPTPEEVAAFLADEQPNAYERVVEKLLNSSQYGERWGRHWLDWVAYADSNGYFNADSDRPLAWKYRDYVIRSINHDKPVNKFIEEQIAGDELAGYSNGGDITPDMVEPLIATHFWRNVPDGSGESDGNPLEVKVDQYSVLEGNVQLLGSAFLGLTLQCARCHDHKFEPVAQREYYSLQAIMRPAFDPAHWLKPNDRAVEIGTKSERAENAKVRKDHEQKLRTLKEGLEGLTIPFRNQILEEKLSGLPEALRKSIRQALDTKEKQRSEEMKALLKTNAVVAKIEMGAIAERFTEFRAAAKPLQESIATLEASPPKTLEKISILSEPAKPAPEHHLFVRGNHAREGDTVGPGVLAALGGTYEPSVSVNSGGTSGRRLALAHWLTSPENPVVARLIVNRVWAAHFGSGLVETPDNFGKSGKAPTYPALLDWLTGEFLKSGWRLKHLNRVILTSSTYRQSLGLALPFSKDPETPLSRRLDAEGIRDAMLAVSGELDLHEGGPYVPIKGDSEGQIIVDENKPGAKRRSIYLQQRRTQPPNVVSTFDGPAHNPVCIQRVHSTVALQSLSLLNSDFVRARARAFAQRLMAARAVGDENEHRLQTAFLLAFGRAGTESEVRAARGFLDEQRKVYGDGKSGAVWTDFCQMLLASNQFLYVD